MGGEGSKVGGRECGRGTLERFWGLGKGDKGWDGGNGVEGGERGTAY